MPPCLISGDNYTQHSNGPHSSLPPHTNRHVLLKYRPTLELSNTLDGDRKGVGVGGQGGQWTELLVVAKVFSKHNTKILEIRKLLNL